MDTEDSVKARKLGVLEPPTPSFRSLQLGFSLIEAVIVLGVVALVIGAIWISATYASQNRLGLAASQGMLSIVSGLRSFYPASSWPSDGAPGELTLTSFISQTGIAPKDWVSSDGSYVLTPWGGSVLASLLYPPLAPSRQIYVHLQVPTRIAANTVVREGARGGAMNCHCSNGIDIWHWPTGGWPPNCPDPDPPNNGGRVSTVCYFMP